MRILFRGLFDESTDVRKVTGRAVARIFDLQHPVCPLYGANLLLSSLPSFLSRPVDWLVESLWSQFSAIASRAETLHKYRAMYAKKPIYRLFLFSQVFSSYLLVYVDG